MGKGAADLLGKVSLNIGVIEGGLKTNMIPERMPGRSRYPHPVRPQQGRCSHLRPRNPARFPAGDVVEESIASETHANWCDPDGEMLQLIQGHAVQVRGIKPVPIATLALTDTRWWRNAGIPAYIYGCAPDGMAQPRRIRQPRGIPATSLRVHVALRRRLSGGRMMSTLGTALLERLKASEAQSVAFLQALLRAPRPTRPATRVPRPRWCWTRCGERGLRSHRHRPARQTCRTSSRASMEPAPGRHLVLNGHIDVFPAADAEWARSPWSGDIVDGRIHGRGACDMKGGLASLTLAFLHLHARARPVARDG